MPEIKSLANKVFSKTELSLPAFFKVNETLSKRQKLTRPGVMKAYRFYKNEEDNTTRKNKIWLYEIRVLG